MAKWLILIMAVLLGGCATRGTMEFDCPRFDTAINGQRPFRTVLPASELERAIRGEIITPEARAASDEARQAEQTEVARFTAQTPGSEGAVALLMSGGGQWGAFGAGFMTRLLDDRRFPRLGLVTGVSTGALQALFVGAGLDTRARVRNRNWAGRDVTPHDPPNYSDLMRYEYSPNREDEIANRNKQWRSVITGSMAGLAPLRQVIENALCENPNDPGECMMDDLARSQILTLIGFVDAEDGNFYYVNVNRIVRNMEVHGAQPPPLPVAERITPLLRREEARQCITAAALASVAMPAFFQQIRVNQRTYFDGGVRRSVFADYAAELAQGANKQAAANAVPASGAKPPPLPPTRVHVLRNGPTSVRAEEAANEPGRLVWDSALRAEQVVVNELEVGSVAGLRLEYQGPLMFRSADEWERFVYHDPALGSRTCAQRKGDGVMFDPDFMRCIMAYGYLVGGQQEVENGPHGWRNLPALPHLEPKQPGSMTGTGTGGAQPPVP